MLDKNKADYFSYSNVENCLSVVNSLHKELRRRNREPGRRKIKLGFSSGSNCSEEYKLRSNHGTLSMRDDGSFGLVLLQKVHKDITIKFYPSCMHNFFQQKDVKELGEWGKKVGLMAQPPNF